MAQISLRVDDDVKHNVEKTLNDIGLSCPQTPFTPQATSAI